MKKKIALLLCLALILPVFAACGRNSPPADPNPAESGNNAASAGTGAPDGALDFPKGTITVIVPFDPGGSSDLSCRAIMSKMEKVIGQPIKVDNIAGANGLTGATSMVKSDPDGYTLAWLASRTNMPEMYSATPPFTSDDMVAISEGVITPGAVVVRSDAGIDTFDELIEYIKANPGTKYGHSGRGNNTHLSAVLLDNTHDLGLVDVPFEGDQNAALALLRGDVMFVFCAANTVVQQVEAGEVKVLAVQAGERIPMYPDIPLFQETNYPIPGIASYIGLFAPAGTPDEIIEFLDKAMEETMKDEELVQTLVDLGFTIEYKNHVDFQKETIDVFYDEISPIIKESGLYED